MEPVLQVAGLEWSQPPPLSFTLMRGQGRVLRLSDTDDLAGLADIVLGRVQPRRGRVLFRGRPHGAGPGSGGSAQHGGHIGWVPVDGGLVNNITIGDNLLLPLWYHRGRLPPDALDQLAFWLDAVGADPAGRADLLSGMPARLPPLYRRQAGLVRALVLGPALLVVDGAVLDGLPAAWRKRWTAALRQFLERGTGRSLLVLMQSEAPMPWPTLGADRASPGGRAQAFADEPAEVAGAWAARGDRPI